MRRNKYYRDFELVELLKGESLMRMEINDPKIESIFNEAWNSFKNNEWSFDGSTFVRSRYKSYWETAAFIHDWRNSMGWVSYSVDREMLDIMKKLGYKKVLIRQRYLFTRLTFINIIRHIIKGNFKKITNDKLYKL